MKPDTLSALRTALGEVMEKHLSKMTKGKWELDEDGEIVDTRGDRVTGLCNAAGDCDTLLADASGIPALKNFLSEFGEEMARVLQERDECANAPHASRAACQLERDSLQRDLMDAEQEREELRTLLEQRTAALQALLDTSTTSVAQDGYTPTFVMNPTSLRLARAALSPPPGRTT